MLTRIAPTPSGYLHTGNAFSFLLTEQLAKFHNGKILLRIDDSDAERKRPEYVQDIFDSLHWLGIEWQNGPKDAQDFETHWSQRHRLPLYEREITKLIAEEKVYACSCSRKQLQENGRCFCETKQLLLDTPDTSLRMKIPQGTTILFSDNNGPHRINLLQETGNFIVRRRDGLPAYHLVSVTDDLHFGVTDIVRGADLFSSTAAQLFLAQQLGEASFSKISFIHHPLLTDEENHKLSKSEGALSLKAQRESGVTAATIRRQFQEWMSTNRIALG